MFNHSQAQFFSKVDDDFKFNGLNLAQYHNNEPVKKCTFVEHLPWGDIYKPPKDKLKTKNFTMENIRYYTDLTEPYQYVWLITATITGDDLVKAHVRKDMSDGSTQVDNANPNVSSYKRMRTYNILAPRANSDTMDLLIVLRSNMSSLDASQHNILSEFPFMSYLGKKETYDNSLRDFLFFCGPASNIKNNVDGTVTYTYPQRGFDITLHQDTIVKYTFHNNGDGCKTCNKKITDYIGTNYTRGQANSSASLGTPTRCSKNYIICWYHRYDATFSVLYSNITIAKSDSDTIEYIEITPP